MNGWRGPVSLRLAERGLQGFYRPAPIRRPSLGATTAQSFPQITASPSANTLTGFTPQSIKDGLLLGLAGGGVAYVSRFLPGPAEPVALIGGVTLLGFGLYKVYESVTGRGTPTVESFQTPLDQQVSDVTYLSGKILEPSAKGQADIGAAWQAVFEGKRTFKTKFMVTNTSAKPITALVEYKSEQTSRPLVGDSEISNFSTSYVLELAPGETKIIPAFQPIKVLETPFQVQSWRSQDIKATLVARTSSSDTGKKLDEISFTAF
jgi:hypothetical protein